MTKRPAVIGPPILAQKDTKPCRRVNPKGDKLVAEHRSRKLPACRLPRSSQAGRLVRKELKSHLLPLPKLTSWQLVATGIRWPLSREN